MAKKPVSKSEFFLTRNERVGLLGLMVVLIVAAFLLDRYNISLFTNTMAVRIWVASFGLLAPLAYIFLMTFAIVVAPIPDFVIGLAAAFLFPWYLASLYTLIGDFLGSSIVFFLARTFGRPLVVHLIKEEHVASINTLTQKLGTKTIFILRLVPGFNFDLIGYAAGLTPIGYRPYILATMLGILPRRIATYYLIDQSIRIDPLLVLVGILLSMVIVPVLAYWLWQWRKTTPNFGK